MCTCLPAGSPRCHWGRRRPPGVRTALRRWTPCWTGWPCCRCCRWAAAGHESDCTSHSTPWNTQHSVKHTCFPVPTHPPHQRHPDLFLFFSSSVYISLGHSSEKDPSPHSQGLWEDNSAVSSKNWLSQDFSLTNLSPIPKYSPMPPSPRLSRTPVAANTRNENHVWDIVVVALSYLNRIKTALIDPAPLSLRDSILWLTSYHALFGARLVCVCVCDSVAIISSDSHLWADSLLQSHTHTLVFLHWNRSAVG